MKLSMAAIVAVSVLGAAAGITVPAAGARAQNSPPKTVPAGDAGFAEQIRKAIERAGDAGTAQSDPPETVLTDAELDMLIDLIDEIEPTDVDIEEMKGTVAEKWSCDDEIILVSLCYPIDGGRKECAGAVKIGDYPPKMTAFRISGIERQWIWCQQDCGFIIEVGSVLNGSYYDFSNPLQTLFDLSKGQQLAKSSHTCTKTGGWNFNQNTPRSN